MAQLLPEQLEFDFFAPPAPEKLKQSENKAKSTAFKDTDILKFQMNYRALTCTVSWERAPISSS